MSFEEMLSFDASLRIFWSCLRYWNLWELSPWKWSRLQFYSIKAIFYTSIFLCILCSLWCSFCYFGSIWIELLFYILYIFLYNPSISCGFEFQIALMWVEITFNLKAMKLTWNKQVSSPCLVYVDGKMSLKRKLLY